MSERGAAPAASVPSTAAVSSAAGVSSVTGAASASSEVSASSASRATPEIEALAGLVEALLFLSPDPVPLTELAEAAQVEPDAIAMALERLGQQLDSSLRGLRLRELGGGYLLASAPATEEAAKRLFSRPRIAALTPAQTETLAIVAYLQPISRPEIGRIRGVSADSATAALLERGLIEEAGRSQFGAALYKTTTSFMKLFGLRALQELPEVSEWDPSPEEQGELRERLLRAGEARAGGGAGGE